MIRLRAGKAQGVAGLGARRHLRKDKPAQRDPVVQLAVGAFRVGHVGARRQDGDGEPAPPASAPRCAAASTPSARPLTTGTRATARLRGERARAPPRSA